MLNLTVEVAAGDLSSSSVAERVARRLAHALREDTPAVAR